MVTIIIVTLLWSVLYRYVPRPYWLYMTYETKKGNNKGKYKNEIGEKTRILSASSKI